MRKSQLLLVALIILAPQTSVTQTNERQDLGSIVRQFTSAFNAQDVDAMIALVSDDVRWIYVNRSSMSAELEGKQALANSMRDYFASCKSCRSKIHGMTCSTERVGVVEVASWEGPSGTKSQASMAIYEFTGQLIQTVYYFPEETEISNHVFNGNCDC